MFCKNCGKEIDNNAFVCPHCGVKVENTPTPAQVAQTESHNNKAKLKKSFNIAANVLAIVLMGIMLIGAIIILLGLDALYEMSGGGPEVEYVIMITKVITILLLVFCIATIIVSSLALAKGNGNKGLGLKITVIVMLAIVAILEFVGDGIVYGILCLVPVAFEIASLCIKVNPEPVATVTYTAPAAPAPTAAPAPVQEETAATASEAVPEEKPADNVDKTEE